MLNDLDKHYRRALAAPAWHYLLDVSEKTTTDIIARLIESFHDYKASRIAPDGTIAVAKLGGGLLDLGTPQVFDGIEFRGTIERKKVDEVEPWQCAGPFVRDEIGLALKLWAGGYESFQTVVLAHGTELVLALVCATNTDTAAIESLIQANEILASFISASAKRWKDVALRADGTAKQRKEQWREVQKLGVAKRRAKADGGRCKRLAIYYKHDRPHATKPEVVSYVFDRIRQPDYQLDLTPGTIARLIAGYERAARLIT